MKNITINVNNKITLLILLILMMGLGSCKKFLEVIPKDQISDASVWSTTQNADLFLNNIYKDLPDVMVWRQGTSAEDPEENFSDNSMNGVDWRPSRTIYALGNYTSSNAPNHWFWYNSIRSCNLFIENVTASNLDTSWKKQSLLQVRFLRAFFYQMLWIHYGGVPIITNVLDRFTQGDSIFHARNTSDEVFKFITDELAAIAPDLPIKPVSGRVSQGAALALKGWCELFQASPLKNPANDKSRWALAAATNKKLMDLSVYSLFPDLANMFFVENNDNVETIFAKKHMAGTATGGLNIHELEVPYVRGLYSGNGEETPTQDLVDDYAMANGLPITDPASGYDPQNPYVNREKRFYQTVIYNGSIWRGDSILTWVGSGSANTLDLPSNSESSNTAYYLLKGLDVRLAVNWYLTNGADFIIFRYAEILLSYAEAQNEASGPDPSVYDAINKVRARSGLPGLPSGLSQDQMRTAIHRERRVELAFEEKRWLDLLRWKIAEKNLNGSLHAMEITKVNGNYLYTVIPAPGGQRAFYPRNYVLPIPQQAMDQNPKLVQNPGY